MLKTAPKLLQTGSFINGHWLGSAASGESYAVYNSVECECDKTLERKVNTHAEHFLM